MQRIQQQPPIYLMYRQWQSRPLSVITKYPALIYLLICVISRKKKREKEKDKAFNPLQSTFFFENFPHTNSHAHHSHHTLNMTIQLLNNALVRVCSVQVIFSGIVCWKVELNHGIHSRKCCLRWHEHRWRLNSKQFDETFLGAPPPLASGQSNALSSYSQPKSKCYLK